jgi:hypothetical protein
MIKYKVDQHKHICDKDEDEWDEEKALIGLCTARSILLTLDEGREGLIDTMAHDGLGIVLFGMIALS